MLQITARIDEARRETRQREETVDTGQVDDADVPILDRRAVDFQVDVYQVSLLVHDEQGSTYARVIELDAGAGEDELRAAISAEAADVRAVHAAPVDADPQPAIPVGETFAV